MIWRFSTLEPGAEHALLHRRNEVHVYEATSNLSALCDRVLIEIIQRFR